MEKVILIILLFLFNFSATADLLIPPEKEAQLKKQYEKNLQKCPKDKPLLDINGSCYSCNELKNVLISKYGGKCEEICPNRYGTYECGSSCILKNPPNKNYSHIPCEGWVPKCSVGYFQDRMDGKCYSCADIKFENGRGLEITKDECLSCPNAQYTPEGCYPKCPKEAPLLVDGKCEPCNLKERSGYVISGCEKCPNRFEKNGGGCYLKCPKQKPILGLDSGECFSCEDKIFKKDSIWQPNDYMVWGCLKCPNQITKVRCMDKEEKDL